jgi:hypothetical protein
VLFSLPSAWTSVGAGGGGSFFEPSFNPANSSEIWVATDQSDEYHSVNGGASWTVPNFNSIQGNHEAPVQYTSTANLLFALGPSNLPEKSTDGGATWTLMAGTPAGNADSFIVNFSNPSQFFISDYSNIYFTKNGGGTFIQIPSSSGYVAGAYFNGSNIYLATDHGVLSSSNGGTSFTATPLGAGIPAGDGIFSFAGSTAGGVTKFYAVTASDSDIYPGQEGNICYSFTGVDSLTAGASSWAAVSGIPAGVDPAFVSMAPNDVNDILLAGGSSAGAPTVVKSANSGSTWTSLFNTTNNANIQTGWQGAGGDRGWGYGEFAMGFAQNPGNPAEMMITDEGGAYLSTDGGASWKATYVAPASLNPAGASTPTGKAYQGNGMEDTSSWYLTFTSPTNILASFTDITGISSADGGATWSFKDDNGNSYNTTYQIVAQPGTGNLYAAVSSIHDIYQWDAYQTNTRIDAGNGAVLTSSNGGSSWTMLHNFAHPVVWQEIDPNHPDTMYVSVVNSKGAGGIYMTTDLQDGATSVWKQLAAPPRTEGHPLDIVVLNDGTVVATYAGTLNSGGSFDDSSGVFVLNAQGTAWTDLTANTTAMQYFDRDITIDPNDPTQSTWYVGVWETTSDPYYPEGGLFKTTNRGLTWTMVPGLPDNEFSAVTFNPSNTKEMYITSGDDGLWYTANAEVASPVFQQVSTYPFSASQRVFFNPYNPSQVWVTSFGYGLAVGAEPSSGETWTGAGDGKSWSDPANWSGDAVPTQNDDVTIPSGVTGLKAGTGTNLVHSITLSSPLDLTTDSLGVDYGTGNASPLSTIVGYLKGGTIFSSTVNANSSDALGYADGSLDGGTAAQPGQVLVKYTLNGDGNLDGVVNFQDLVVVVQNFNKSGTDWATGNFNFGASTNFGDLVAVVQNFNKVLTPAAGSGEQLGGMPSPIGQKAVVAVNQYQSTALANLAVAAIDPDKKLLESVDSPLVI